MVRYNVNNVTKGVNNFGNYFPDVTYTATLAASTETNFDVPNTGAMGYPKTGNGINKFVAAFSFGPDSSVWVAKNATAELPAGATMALSASSSVLNPTGLIVQGGDTLSFISADTPDVCVSIYAIQE